MRLALSENRLTQWKELRHELTPRDLTELIAFWSLEPWGDRRADIRAALMAAVVAGSNGHEVDLHKLTNYMEPEEGDEDLQASGFASPNSAAASMAQMFPMLIK